MYAAVVVQLEAPGLNQPFTYRIPDAMTLHIGDAVVVPFSGQLAVGYVVGLSAEPPEEIAAAKIRAVTARIENGSAFDRELFELAEWVARETLCDLQEAVRLIAPEVLGSAIKTTLTLADDWGDLLALTRSQPQHAVADALASLGGSATPAQVSRLLPSLKVGPIVSELRKKGVLTETRSVSLPKAREKKVRVLRLAVDIDVAEEEATRLEKTRAKKQAEMLRALIESSAPASLLGAPPNAGIAVGPGAHASARALAEKGLAAYAEATVQRNPFRFFGMVSDTAPPLTDAQATATKEIGAHIALQDGSVTLLHGVTGSGKTEVYLDLVARTLAQGQNALILLPEIGLTTQLLDLFKARFGEDDVAVLHSALSLGERYDEWQRIKSGAARVVLGARSAVFAPVTRLGLIVMDEEHDGSYKQDSSPRYHARDAALRRAERSGAIVVLGSATPSLESFYRAKTGRYGLVTLSERISSRPLPPVHIVDLREEFRKKPEQRKFSPKTEGSAAEEEAPSPARSIFSEALMDAIGDRLERQEQTILFLNRRGFATFLLCRDCGHTPVCPNCDVSLTYHHGARLLQCHHCDFRAPAPADCPICGGLRIRPFGLGTEKVEEAVHQAFPEARTLRMDRDTMARKGAHAETLRTFRRGEADILIGTQIVAKGLDFPNVTLVGVVSADTALNVPDFRSGERAFQLLTQVAGRAGRGTRPGEVFVQTFSPEHTSVLRAAEHDYLNFYAEEIETRQELSYPPFSHMANLVISDEDETLAAARSQTIVETLRQSIETQNLPVTLLGPVTCPLARLRNRYRWHIVARTPSKATLLKALRGMLSALSASDRQGLSLDIDPLTML
ncbi:MAG: primosomal protein N' [Capsulimonas sp.]|uniref:replication restart helicase PriA n=1 Tax=Capsulimonas sp. TaxID=2494211 RepID=UPI0032660A81